MTSDTMCKADRSALMRRIRGDSLKSELALADALARAGADFYRNVRDLPGSPDFVLDTEESALAVFVHGCFWHCCPDHWKMPKFNRERWAAKFAGNTRRDRSVRRKLVREYGYRTAVVWEHDLRTASGADRAAARVLGMLGRMP